MLSLQAALEMAIANFSQTKIPVKELLKCLDSYVALRGRVLFGFPGDCLDQIVLNYKDLWWWISADGLKTAYSRIRSPGYDLLLAPMTSKTTPPTNASPPSIGGRGIRS